MGDNIVIDFSYGYEGINLDIKVGCQIDSHYNKTIQQAKKIILSILNTYDFPVVTYGEQTLINQVFYD